MINRLDLANRITVAAADLFRSLHEADTPLIFEALLAAEDGRGQRHLGTDWLSILRAVALAPVRGRIEGLSTIEHQLARTIFPRGGDHLLRDKFDEIVLAERLARRLPKATIWGAYLELAYYGADLRGYTKIRAIFVKPDAILDLDSACRIAACLKYPRPNRDRVKWRARHGRRTAFIREQVERVRRARSRHSRACSQRQLLA